LGWGYIGGDNDLYYWREILRAIRRAKSDTDSHANCYCYCNGNSHANRDSNAYAYCFPVNASYAGSAASSNS
jgi:hypothetical protein